MTDEGYTTDEALAAMAIVRAVKDEQIAALQAEVEEYAKATGCYRQRAEAAEAKAEALATENEQLKAQLKRALTEDEL